jgi:5-methylcytosine-specific restriction endonuclease McrA
MTPPHNPRQLCSGWAWQRATAPARRAWAFNNLPCSLCGEPINYLLRSPHRMSLTVDHIVPLGVGGPPLDPANWRPAHYSCNSRRGRAQQNRVRGPLAW